MARFHAAPWPERATMVRQFADERYRHLALRLVYFERPDLLDATIRGPLEAQMGARISAGPDAETRWRTFELARREANNLIAGGLGEEVWRDRALISPSSMRGKRGCWRSWSPDS